MPVTIFCQKCGRPIKVKPSLALHKKYCSKKCTDEAFRERFAGPLNPAYGKVYRTKSTHPEWAKKISQTDKEKHINCGDKNGMKSLAARTKASNSRKKLLSDPSQRKRLCSDPVRRAWADGKYEHAAVGRCQWYDVQHPDGRTIKCQGTWELKFAQWMIANGMSFISHQGRIPYTGADGTEHSYYPDFWIEDWKCYVDVKGAMWNDEQTQKFELIRKTNPDISLRILMKEDLRALGVDVK